MAINNREKISSVLGWADVSWSTRYLLITDQLCQTDLFLFFLFNSDRTIWIPYHRSYLYCGGKTLLKRNRKKGLHNIEIVTNLVEISQTRQSFCGMVGCCVCHCIVVYDWVPLPRANVFSWDYSFIHCFHVYDKDCIIRKHIHSISCYITELTATNTFIHMVEYHMWKQYTE